MLDKVLSQYCDKVVIERGGGIGIGLRIRIPLYNIVAHGQTMLGISCIKSKWPGTTLTAPKVLCINSPLPLPGLHTIFGYAALTAVNMFN